MHKLHQSKQNSLQVQQFIRRRLRTFLERCKYTASKVQLRTLHEIKTLSVSSLVYNLWGCPINYRVYHYTVYILNNVSDTKKMEFRAKQFEVQTFEWCLFEFVVDKSSQLRKQGSKKKMSWWEATRSILFIQVEF